MTSVLEMESLIDETLVKFIEKLGKRFADGSDAGKPFAGDEWLSFCESNLELDASSWLTRRASRVGCHRQHQLRSPLRLHRPGEGRGQPHSRFDQRPVLLRAGG